MSDQDQARPAASGDGRGALRVSHEDRDQVAEALRVAAGDGRLSSDELDERLERALTARTYDELAVLVAGLPPAGNALALAPGTQLPGPLAAVLGGGVASAPAKELIKIQVTSGHSQRVGRWTVPARMDVEVSSGHILLLTRPGIAVDLDDVAVRSGQVKAHAPWGENVPVFLRISVAGKCGSGHILARPPRRSFWQWLRRAPRRYAIAA